LNDPERRFPGKDRLPPPAYELSRELVLRARDLVEPHVLFTPVVPSPLLSELLGHPVVLKCESQQRTGSFKIRGALARLQSLSREERPRGVVAASAGNHGLGVAWACRLLGIPALVVLPESAPRVKREAIAAMGAKVRLHGAGYDEAEARARAIAAEAGASFVSPFDDPVVMAGNGGTLGLEIARQVPDAGAVVAPVGGGGLAAGLAVALPGVPVVGVNTEASPAMARTLAEGRVLTEMPAARTLAEGLEGGVSPSSAALCARLLRSVEVVREASIREAIRLLARRHGLVVEGSGAVTVAALLEKKEVPLGARPGPVCLVLTGRNIDRERLREIVA
jgi:threonine dehydratase